MGRSSSASTNFQQQMKLLHNKNVDAEQTKDIHYGTVLQTDVSVGSAPGVPIPTGMMTIHVPDLGSNHVSDALPYPGATAPLIGTQVSIGFDSDSNPIVIAMYGAATYRGSSADNPTAVKTTAYTASAADLVICNPSSPFAVTLPTSPANGTLVAIEVISGATSYVTLTAGGGNTVRDSTLHVNAGQQLVLSYGVTLSEWETVTEGTLNPASTVSPALTGSPTAPTQTTGDNTTLIATDQFVQTAIANAVAGKNAIINGGMDIWQRGTSFALPAATNTYTADRWIGTGTISSTITATKIASGLTGFSSAIRMQRTNAIATQPTMYLASSIETVNSLPFAGQVVTFSFYARCGANYSPTGSAISVSLFSGTGTDQNIGSSYTGSVNVVNTTATLTTSWQKFTYTATVGSTANELGCAFTATTVGTAGAADYFDITGVQLELGSVATPFSRAGGSIGGELALCQRYYYQISSTSSVPYAPTSNQTTGSANALVPFPVKMRAAPSFTSSAATLFSVFSLNGAVAASALAAVTTGPDNGSITVTTGLIVAGHAGYLESNSTMATFIAFSAEL